MKRPFVKGTTPVRGLTITMVTNYLLTGMILQVPRYFWSWKFWVSKSRKASCDPCIACCSTWAMEPLGRTAKETFGVLTTWSRRLVDTPKNVEKVSHSWVVVANIFYFHPYLGKIPILTNIFQRGWNHQPDKNLFVVHLATWMVDMYGKCR